MNYDGIFAFYRVILFWGETRQEVEENIKLLHRANVLKECVEPKRCIDAIWESDELVSKYFNAESLYFGSVMLRTHITEHSTQVLEPDENKPLFFALVFNDHTAFTFQGKYVLSQPTKMEELTDFAHNYTIYVLVDEESVELISAVYYAGKTILPRGRKLENGRWEREWWEYKK